MSLGLATDKNRIRRFVLYGSESPLCRCENILNIVEEKLTKDDCPTLIRFLTSEVGAARALNEVRNVIKSFKATPETPRRSYNKAAACLALVLIIKSRHSKPHIKRDAYSVLDLVCLTSEDLFLFHHYHCYAINHLMPVAEGVGASGGADNTAADNTAADNSADNVADAPVQPPRKKRGHSCSGMKRFINRWYNSRDPLALAIDCTGVVHRFGQTHSVLIKYYHPSSKTKGLEIVFACIGIRGGICVKSKTRLAAIVAKYETRQSSGEDTLDEKAVEVLNYYKKLAQLHLLLKDEEVESAKSKDVKSAARNKVKEARQKGKQASDAAAILKEIEVPILRGVPYEFWHSPDVMDVLMRRMTVRQVLEHLPRLSVCGKLSSWPSMEYDPLTILADEGKVAEEGVDPFEVVAAMRRFECGKYKDVKFNWTQRNQGRKPRRGADEPVRLRKSAVQSWEVTGEAVNALCRCYDIALHVQPAFPAKKVLITVDVASENSQKPVSGGLVGVTAETGIGIMVNILVHACRGVGNEGGGEENESGFEVKAFSIKDKKKKDDADEPDFPTLDVKPKDSPDDICKKMELTHRGDVDIAALLNHCVEKQLRYDAFIVLAGAISTPQPADKYKNALDKYRTAMGMGSAKMVVVGIAAKMFCIADPNDGNSLDVLGLSASCVHQIRRFLAE